MGKLRTSAGIGGIISSNVVAKSKNCVDEKAALASSCSWEIPQDHHDQCLQDSLSSQCCYWTAPFLKVLFLASRASGLNFPCSALSESIYTAITFKPYRLAWKKKKRHKHGRIPTLSRSLTPSHDNSSRNLSIEYLMSHSLSISTTFTCWSVARPAEMVSRKR